MSSPHKTTVNSPTKATQVFETVELLENIMLNLGVGDILKAMQATRAMYDTVLGSTKIKMSIGLLPNYDCHFSAMPWEGPDADRDFLDLTHIRQRHPSNHPEQKFHGFTFSNYYGMFDGSYGLRGYEDLDRVVSARRQDPRKLLHADFMLAPEGVYPSSYNVGPDNDNFFYKMGSRVRMLSICQPPVSTIEVNIICRDCRLYPRYDTVDASNGA